MKNRMKTIALISLLIFLSILVYLVQYFIFRRPTDTGFYLLEDLAFVPINVLLVTLGINTVLVRREKKAMLEKVGIVVNEFFAESGRNILLALKEYPSDCEQIYGKLRVGVNWSDRDFNASRTFFAANPICVDIRTHDLELLRTALEKEKDSLLRLFENANLMEHDTFTDMLWAVYHVYDELRSRESLGNLPAADLKHLNADVERAIRLLFAEWLDQMRVLKARYPYLYSLAVRKNPFAPGRVIIDS
jgi:hypothetical protein